LAEFGYGKYVIVPFLVHFDSVSGLFGLAMSILAQLCIAKVKPMALPNSPNMPPKIIKKVIVLSKRMFEFICAWLVRACAVMNSSETSDVHVGVFSNVVHLTIQGYQVILASRN